MLSPESRSGFVSALGAARNSKSTMGRRQRSFASDGMLSNDNAEIDRG